MSDHEPLSESGQEPLAEPDAVRKDMRYTPGSDTETREKQDEAATSPDDDVPDDRIRTRPGTGGPDDVGDVEVDPDELNMPHSAPNRQE